MWARLKPAYPSSMNISLLVWQELFLNKGNSTPFTFDENHLKRSARGVSGTRWTVLLANCQRIDEARGFLTFGAVQVNDRHFTTPAWIGVSSHLVMVRAHLAVFKAFALCQIHGSFPA